MIVNKIGIVGLGLMGGSLAKAIKSRKLANQVIAFNRSPEPLIQAKEENIIDDYTIKINGLFADCDMIFISTPVHTIASIVKSLQPFTKKDCIFTDVGSTKSTIMEQLDREDIDGLIFIGGHPMAGSEKSGYIAGKEHLFENAYYILTPGKNAAEAHIEALKAIAQGIGALPVVVDAKAHDKAVAGISHGPHVVASALVNTIRNLDDSGLMHTLAAGGFKDITRIASSSPEMWHAISFENKREILSILGALEQTIQEFKDNLNGSNHEAVQNFFINAKAYRDSFASGSSGAFLQDYEIQVEIRDRPGIVATVATMLSIHDINLKNIGIINNRESETGVLHIVFSTKEHRDKSVRLLQEMNFMVHIKQ